MAQPTNTYAPRHRTATERVVGILALVTLVGGVVGLAGCSKSTDEALQYNNAGFMIEPAAAVGPDAFTPPVTNDTSICDKQQLIRELQSRPDAYREWARVLGVAPDAVPAYIESLQPVVLTSDTKVTNHGLRNGQAYARPSVLTSGTAVLMNAQKVPTATEPPRTTTTTKTTTTTTTPPAVDVPVTRCKCGNPLLPPPTTNGSTPPGSTGTTPPGTTGTTPPQTRPTRSSVPSSSTTTTPQQTTTTTPSSSSTTLVRSSSTATTSSAVAAPPIRDIFGFGPRAGG